MESWQRKRLTYADAQPKAVRDAAQQSTGAALSSPSQLPLDCLFYRGKTRSSTCWLKLGVVGCLGGVPMGTALTGGLPMTGEDDRLGSARSETSCSSSRGCGGLWGRAYSSTDTEGTSCTRKGRKTHPLLTCIWRKRHRQATE